MDQSEDNSQPRMIRGSRFSDRIEHLPVSSNDEAEDTEEVDE